MSWSRPVDVGDLDDVEHRDTSTACRPTRRASSRGHSGVAQLAARACRTPRARRRRARRAAPAPCSCAPGSKRSIGLLDVDRARVGAHQPARRALDQPTSLDQHRQLGLGVDLVVERLDLRPRTSACRTPRARPRTRARESTAGAPVSSPSRNANVVPARSTSWLATTVAMISRLSRCERISLAVALGQRWREVALEVVGQVRILGQVGLEQLRVQVDLAVRHHHGQLGRDQPLMCRLALRDRPRRRAGTRARDPARRPARGSGSGARGRRPSAPPEPGPGSSPASGCSCRTAPGRRPRRSSRPAARCAAWRSCRRRRPATPSRILMLTSWSEQLTPATLSIASVLIRPPASAYSIRPR